MRAYLLGCAILTHSKKYDKLMHKHKNAKPKKHKKRNTNIQYKEKFVCEICLLNMCNLAQIHNYYIA